MAQHAAQFAASANNLPPASRRVDSLLSCDSKNISLADTASRLRRSTGGDVASLVNTVLTSASIQDNTDHSLASL